MDASSSAAATIPATSTFIPPTSLCPGYKEVDAFNPNDDYYSDDEEDDVSYVTLDLGNIEPTLVPSSSTYRLIGLDTPTPFLQLSGTILKGRHDSLLGTELLFADGKDVDKSKRSIAFAGSTSQRISFREVQLVPKGFSGSAPSSPVDEKFRARGKGKALEGNDEPDSLIVQEVDVRMVDRVTGKMIPKARASKGKKGKAKLGSDDEVEGDEAAEKGGGKKGKSRAKVTGKERAKGKGKEKEKGVVLARDGVDGDGTADDMDVDER